MKIPPLKYLDTENLESILIDEAGTPGRLKNVLREYLLRDDKNEAVQKYMPKAVQGKLKANELT